TEVLSSTARPFVLDITLLREPTDTETEGLLSKAVMLCEEGTSSSEEVAGLANLTLSPPGAQALSRSGGPSLVVTSTVLGVSGAPQYVTVGMPYADERAKRF